MSTTNTEIALTFDGVTRFYGPVIGLGDVTLRFGPGVTGLLGTNGAGKSTLLKLASGRLRPTQGCVRIRDFDATSLAAKRLLGYCPEINKFYEEMTGREFVRTMTRLYGYSWSETRQRTEAALDRVGMLDRADRALGGYSHGMRQRIKLAQAVAHEPRVLLLDEPLTGIDPAGRREVNQLIRDLADEGRTVVVSSHLLVELEQSADHLVMLQRGRVQAEGTLAELRRRLDDQPLTIRIESPQARRLAAICVAGPEVAQVEVRGDAVTIRTTDAPQFFVALNELIAAHSQETEPLVVERMETLDAGAEAVFDYLQRGAT